MYGRWCYVSTKYYVRIVSDGHRDLERQAQKMQAGIPRHEPLERKNTEIYELCGKQEKISSSCSSFEKVIYTNRSLFL